jgi:hypothetical protein
LRFLHSFILSFFHSFFPSFFPSFFLSFFLSFLYFPPFFLSSFPSFRFLIKGDGNALRVKINSRALDPTGPMYQTPSPHQGFGGNPFLEEGDYNRGPGGHSPGHSMREGEPYRRDSLGGPGHMEREMMQQQQFNMKGPSGYPMSMRGKEPFRNPNSPYPADNRINSSSSSWGMDTTVLMISILWP